MNIALNAETQNLILKFAKEAKISKENLIKNAIFSYLEDLQDKKIADEAYQVFLENKQDITSAKSLYDELGL